MMILRGSNKGKEVKKFFLQARLKWFLLIFAHRSSFRNKNFRPVQRKTDNRLA